MRYEQKVWAPLWIELSGLPELLTEKVRPAGGWQLFKKIVELDCTTNPRPGTLEIPVTDLARRTGLKPTVIRKLVPKLRKLKLIASFLPDHDEEEALFQIKVPLPTPIPWDEVRRLHPEYFRREGHYFRYAMQESGEEDDSDDVLLKEIVDMYFNTVGTKMNAFILDELRLIRQQFPIDLIRRTFFRARKNEIHSFPWIMRELMRQKRSTDDKKADGTDDMPEM
jgi:DNA-binding Lrp family transcriptional regulator